MIYLPMNCREGQPTAHFNAARLPEKAQATTRSTKRRGGRFRAMPSMKAGK